jgi:Ca2+-binding RTX toxin-like protein
LVEGTDVDDEFNLEASEPNPAIGRFTAVVIGRETSLSAYQLVVRETIRPEGDALTVEAKGGHDLLDATRLGIADATLGIERTDLIAVTLVGGAGNDRLIGSPFDDILESGTGSDTVTGGEGLTFSAMTP